MITQDMFDDFEVVNIKDTHLGKHTKYDIALVQTDKNGRPHTMQFSQKITMDANLTDGMRVNLLVSSGKKTFCIAPDKFGYLTITKNKSNARINNVLLCDKLRALTGLYDSEKVYFEAVVIGNRILFAVKEEK